MYLPCHLYGELSKREEGILIIRNETIVPRLTEKLATAIKSPSLYDSKMRKCDREDEELSLLPLKSTLWALVCNLAYVITPNDVLL